MKARIIQSFEYGTQDGVVFTAEVGTIAPVTKVLHYGVLVLLQDLPVTLDFEEYELILEEQDDA